MPFLPAVIITLLTSFDVVFTKPTFEHLQILLIGSILCTGKRTVTSALKVMGLSQEKNFSKYHRVLNGSKWNLRTLAKILLGLLLVLIPTGSPIIIAMDETLERRKGKKIQGKGCYRDACRSTKSLVIKCYGLKWQCAAIIVKLPWSKHYCALPFMTALCLAKTYDDKDKGYNVINMVKSKTDLGNAIGYYKGKLYHANNEKTNIKIDDKLSKKLLKSIKKSDGAVKRKTLIQRNIHGLGKKDFEIFFSLCGQKRIKHRSSVDYARVMMLMISHYLKRKWILLGDGGFACIKLGLACVEKNVTLISRLRLDAGLYENPDDEPQNKRGRKRLKGKKTEQLKELIKKPNLEWQKIEVNWYSGDKKFVNILTGTSLWYTTGYAPLPIRWVIIHNLETGKFEAFFSTDLEMDAISIVEYFVLRWNIEVTFEESRAHMGIETQRQSSKNAINRTTPLLMGLYSLVHIMAHKLTNGMPLPVASTAWYDKNGYATFSDTIAYVKSAIIKEKYINKSIINDEFVQIPLDEWEQLINNGFFAA